MPQDFRASFTDSVARLPVRLFVRMAVLALLLFALVPVTAFASVRFQLDATATAVEPGDIFGVSVEVPVSGDAFNGYDAILRFDTTRLEVLLPSPPSAGEGALFTGACALRFLDLSQDGDSARVRVSHVVLCAGVSLTGPGTVYTLQFRARDVDGIAVIELVEATQAYDAGYDVITETGTPLAIQVGEVTAAPPRLHAPALRVVPNPFNPGTEIHFELDVDQDVQLGIFDAAGRRVRSLWTGRLHAGSHRFRWDGRDVGGRPVASGTYVSSLFTHAGRTHARLTLVR